MAKEPSDTEISKQFDSARNLRDFEQLNLEIAVGQGQLDQTQLNLRSKFSLTGAAIRDSVAEKRKTANSTYDFIRMLDRMNDYADGLRQGLIDKYGENYIDAIFADLLPDEDPEGLTEEEKSRMIFDEYLDENRNIKPEYAGTDKGQTAFNLYKEQEGARLDAKARAVGDTPEMREEIEAFTKDAGIFGNTEFRNNAESITGQRLATESVQNDLVTVAADRTTSLAALDNF